MPKRNTERPSKAVHSEMDKASNPGAMSEVPRSGADRGPALEPRLSKVSALLLQGIALAVPLFYAAGRLYSEAYWQGLGLSVSLLDRSTPDFVFFGFVALVNALAYFVGLDPYSAMGKIVAIAGVVGAILLLVWAIGRWLMPWLRRRAQTMDANLERFRQLAKHEVVNRIVSILSLALGLAYVLFVMLWCCLVLFLFVALASQEGRRGASATRRAFVDGHASAKSKQPPPALVRFESSVAAPARLLECSSRWCIVFQNGGFSAVPASSVTIIEQHRRDS